jgi:hypothetical protein
MNHHDGDGDDERRHRLSRASTRFSHELPVSQIDVGGKNAFFDPRDS